MRCEAGVDYLTVVASLDCPDKAQVVAYGHKLIKEEQSNGNSIKEGIRLGYAGFKCGGVFVGEADQGALVQVSGFTANKAVKLYKGTKAKITRIDLQVTVWYDSDTPEIIRRYASVAEADASVSDERTKRQIRKVEDNAGGFTLYIGSRTSAYFGRLYDKYAETKDESYRQALRFEIEVKQERAEQLFRQFTTVNRAKTERIKSFVAEWYGSRGVYVPFLFKANKMALEPLSREKSDNTRRLAWLKNQVRHTVLELRKTVDDTVILEALGFFEELTDE